MKSHLVALAAVAAIAVVLPASAQADARDGVVHIVNNTNSVMSFYRQWVWNYGESGERVQIAWKLTKIPAGATLTVHHTYPDAARQSPELIVVFDCDRNNGAHWTTVKLARGASANFRDRRSGFTYVLEYDDDRREFASLRASNGGTVTVLERESAPPRGVIGR
jgi:hypothetical protein